VGLDSEADVTGVQTDAQKQTPRDLSAQQPVCLARDSSAEVISVIGAALDVRLPVVHEQNPGKQPHPGAHDTDHRTVVTGREPGHGRRAPDWRHLTLDPLSNGSFTRPPVAVSTM